MPVYWPPPSPSFFRPLSLLSESELEEIFNNNDNKLMDLQDKIELLNQRMMDALYTPITGIQPRANFYRTCQP